MNSAQEPTRQKLTDQITFVVCVKRHAMRFFAQNAADGDRTGNLPPGQSFCAPILISEVRHLGAQSGSQELTTLGTVVDTNVCHPFAFDFYLQAHQGLQGTARPTH